MKNIIVTILTTIVGVVAWAQHVHTEHGFILLGKKQMHAYHLAKFNSPHEYQVVFEVQLKHKNGSSFDLSELSKNDKVFSLLSEDQFLIKDLIDQNNPVSKFKAKLFKGYLRDKKNRELIEEGVSVEVIRIDYFKKIEKNHLLSGKQILMTCDKKTNDFYVINSIYGVDEAGRSFEEIAKIAQFYDSGGAAGEDLPGDSIGTYISCDVVQGRIFDVQTKGHIFPSIPFEPENFYNHSYKVFLNYWRDLLIYELIVLDINSVNN